VRLELLLADLEAVERRQEKTRTAAKGRPADYAAELAGLDALHARLANGQALRGAELSPLEGELVHELNLLSAKPLLYVANVGEGDLPAGGPLVEPLRHLAQSEGSQAVVICAECEAGLTDWTPEDACAYLRELGVNEPGLLRFIQAGYRLLNLITFFTTTGGKEVRAWPIVNGLSVLEAAGRIHTDMQRGFVRAEVLAYDDLMKTGSTAAARDKGLVHLEGRDYIVRDGDIVHVRFNV